METNDELKEIDFKNRTGYFLTTQLDLKILILIIFPQIKNYKKIFQLITVHRKLLLVLNLFVSGSIKQMSLLELMMELDIQYYLELKCLISAPNDMISFSTELHILQE